MEYKCIRKCSASYIFWELQIKTKGNTIAAQLEWQSSQILNKKKKNAAVDTTAENIKCSHIRRNSVW
jgi:hypothetical protein